MARPVSQRVQHRQTGGFLVELETEVLNWLDFFFPRRSAKPGSLYKFSGGDIQTAQWADKVSPLLISCCPNFLQVRTTFMNKKG